MAKEQLSLAIKKIHSDKIGKEEKDADPFTDKKRTHVSVLTEDNGRAPG